MSEHLIAERVTAVTRVPGRGAPPGRAAPGHPLVPRDASVPTAGARFQSEHERPGPGEPPPNARACALTAREHGRN